MSYESSQAVAIVGQHPIHSMLVAFPIAYFTGALVTDLAYWQTAEMQWANFSVWLLTAGLVMSALASLAGAIDFLFNRRIRAMRAAWPHVIGTVLVVALALVNVLVHSRDAYTSVVPTGLILSALVVVILLVTNWLGSAMVYRQGVGASSR
jgi:uncharacterized membrane protein